MRELNLQYLLERQLVPMVVLLVVGVLLATISLATVPFSTPMQNYLQAAQHVLQGSKIESGFWPVGYTAFLILCMKYVGLRGVFAGQALLYVATIILTYSILHLLDTDTKIAFATSIIVSVHPYLLLNIKRIVDTNLTIPLLLGFVLSLLWIRTNSVSYGPAILAGALFGYLVLVRPNFVTLMPLLFLIPFSRIETSRRQRFLMEVSILITALVVVSMVTIPLTGRILAFPANGAYNLFAGANHYTREALISNYNAESSIGKALHDLKMSESQADRDANYWHYSVSYVLQNPLQFAFLAVLKVATVFRPDYRQVDTSAMASPSVIIVVQTIIALPIVLWVFVRIACRRSVGVLKGPLALPFMILYLLPFAVANADPRFRLPVDVILILDIAYSWNACNRLHGKHSS